MVIDCSANFFATLVPTVVLGKQALYDIVFCFRSAVIERVLR